MFGKRAIFGPPALLPARSNSTGAGRVTEETAWRQSAVWAALHLRANLISSFPIDTFRKGPGGVQIETAKPPVLVSPSNKLLSIREWMYSTQIDLDRYGNCYGIIQEQDGAGRPAQIDLVAQSDVTILSKHGEISYRIKGATYSSSEIWHERQYTIPGLGVGLSPITYAAWSMSSWQSASEFAREYFSNRGIVPNLHLRNTKKTLSDGEADKVKSRFKVAVEGADLFVTGNDWEFPTVSAAVADTRFLDVQGYSDADVARFFGVPGDLIDVATKGQSITYANITQRNLQLLIMHLGGAVARREDALSTLLPAPRFVKLNTAAILRMDPETTSRILTSEVAGKITAPSEARALLNRQPFTPEQLVEFEQLGILHQLPPAPLAPQIGGTK